MAKSDLERKAEQIRGQIEDLRANLDDVLHNYNKLVSSGTDWFSSAQAQVSRAARQAKGNVAEVGEGLTKAGIPWWAPVAAIAAIGAVIALANMTGLFGGNPGERNREEYIQNMAGQTPPYGMPGQP